jgi:predicted butyrate kinase (DUF1464 family)
MDWDVKAFEKAKFAPREEDVTLSFVAVHFGMDKDTPFRVRGLSIEEIARAKSDAARANVLTGMLEKLTSPSDKDKVDGILMALGASNDVPSDVIQKYSNVEYGLVEPKLPRSVIVKMGKYFPAAIMLLNKKIEELTALGGSAVVKP